MKCFVMKNGDIVPADKVADIREKDGKTIIKYVKTLTLTNVARTMTCYDEAIAFKNMKENK